MNSNNIGGFRDFASKLREQVKKLPSFDDMAAKDEYIHTEEFNVPSNNNTDSSISTTNNSGNNVDEASYSTESSWSLLDRPTAAEAMGTQAKRNNDSDNNSLTDNENNSTNEILSIADSRQEIAKSTSIPLLSIVSDALQQTSPIFPSISQDENDNSDDDNSYSNSDHSSEDLMDDEEDPILSMIRKNNNNDNSSNNRKQPATTSVTTKKSSNRFMDDLRLQTPTENENYAIQQQQQQQQQETTTTTTQHQQPRIIERFFNRILKRGSDVASNVPISLPPLNFQRTPKAVPVKQEEENFEITTSTLVLGDEDLKQLEELKKGGRGVSSSQNQHYIFIVFTLLLAIFVYFYTRKDIEDDVT